MFVINFQLFDVVLFQEFPQSDFSGIMKAESMMRLEKIKKVVQVETAKLRDSSFQHIPVVNCFYAKGQSGKVKRKSCRHFNCIYPYLNFNETQVHQE